jgi:hypothetical protein
MRLYRKGTSHIELNCFIYDAMKIEYREREEYALLRLPGVDVFIYSQEALDKLREVLKKPETSVGNDDCGPGSDRCVGGRDGLDPVTPCKKHEGEG